MLKVKLSNLLDRWASLAGFKILLKLKENCVKLVMDQGKASMTDHENMCVLLRIQSYQVKRHL